SLGWLCSASTRGASCPRSALVFLHEVLEGVAEERGRLGTDAVGLAILRLFAAVAERLLLIPLSFRNDVANLVIRQADQHAVPAGQLLVNRRLDRSVGEVGAGVGRILHLVENEFRINLPRNSGD